jgi:hypothetical protein
MDAKCSAIVLNCPATGNFHLPYNLCFPLQISLARPEEFEEQAATTIPSDSADLEKFAAKSKLEEEGRQYNVS